MRINQTITIVAGTPVNVFTGSATAPSVSSRPVYATRIYIQMLHGGSGIGYVMAGVPAGRTPASSNAGDLSSELAPADGTSPGGSYSDTDANPAGGIDIRGIWVDGGNSGDTVKVSYDLKI